MKSSVQREGNLSLKNMYIHVFTRATLRLNNRLQDQRLDDKIHPTQLTLRIHVTKYSRADSLHQV